MRTDDFASIYEMQLTNPLAFVRLFRAERVRIHIGRAQRRNKTGWKGNDGQEYRGTSKSQGIPRFQAEKQCTGSPASEPSERLRSAYGAVNCDPLDGGGESRTHGLAPIGRRLHTSHQRHVHAIWRLRSDSN
jgi:hypothetical protein